MFLDFLKVGDCFCNELLFGDVSWDTTKDGYWSANFTQKICLNYELSESLKNKTPQSPGNIIECLAHVINCWQHSAWLVLNAGTVQGLNNVLKAGTMNDFLVKLQRDFQE